MTDLIAAAGQAGGNDAMRTIRVSNPDVSPGGGFALSDAARSALAQIGQMQGDYNREIGAARGLSDEIKASQSSPAADPAASAPADRMADAAELLGRQIEASARVQEQLAKFVMASSVSSSFGRDLNMFLRGQ